MYLSAETKKEIFKKYGNSETNTGSTEGQIALFTHRINYLTEHLKLQKKEGTTGRRSKEKLTSTARINDHF